MKGKYLRKIGGLALTALMLFGIAMNKRRDRKVAALFF